MKLISKSFNKKGFIICLFMALSLITTAANPAHLSASIWQDIGSEFKLGNGSNAPQVQTEIKRLLADRAKLEKILTAATPYIYFIHQSTKAKKLPSDITLIPFIESEFSPNDYSSKGATGLWQLMAGTASQLGIKMRYGYDGRRNVVTSTQAALAHLKYLESKYHGNWYYALAAYNCGEARFNRALRYARNQSFWSLHLPRETKRYVAKLLAITLIVKNPEKYNVKIPKVDNKPFFEIVELKKSIPLTQIAKKTGIELNTLRKLNPDFRQGRILSQSGKYKVLIPAEYVSKIKNFG